MATKPVMVMDPITITGDPGAKPAELVSTSTWSSSLAIGSWLIPYWLIGAGVLTVGALGVSFVVGGKKRRKRSKQSKRRRR